jgi:hypothetical protein
MASIDPNKLIWARPVHRRLGLTYSKVVETFAETAAKSSRYQFQLTII